MAELGLMEDGPGAPELWSGSGEAPSGSRQEVREKLGCSRKGPSQRGLGRACHCRPPCTIDSWRGHNTQFCSWNKNWNSSAPKTMGDIWALNTALWSWSLGSSLALWSQASPGTQGVGGLQGEPPMAPSRPSLFWPLGSSRREQVRPGPQGNPTRCGGAGGYMPSGAQVDIRGWRAAPVACVLHVTLPSRGPVTSVPREPQPKSRGDGGVRGRIPQAEHGCTLIPAPAGSALGTRKACVATPHPRPLQAAFLLPRCLIPGHTATEYAICVGAMPPRPHPHPGQPLDPPRQWLLRPPVSACLYLSSL